MEQAQTPARKIELRFSTSDGLRRTVRHNTLPAAQNWFRTQFGAQYQSDPVASQVTDVTGDARVHIKFGCSVAELEGRHVA